MEAIREYIGELDNKKRASDALVLLKTMQEASGYQPYLHGKIIGYGKYDYHYESGTRGTSAVVAFSPRKQNLVVYIMPGFDHYQQLLKELGKFKLGKSCLYINKLADVDLSTLSRLVSISVKDMQKKYTCRD